MWHKKICTKIGQVAKLLHSQYNPSIVKRYLRSAKSFLKFLVGIAGSTELNHTIIRDLNAYVDMYKHLTQTFNEGPSSQGIMIVKLQYQIILQIGQVQNSSSNVTALLPLTETLPIGWVVTITCRHRRNLEGAADSGCCHLAGGCCYCYCYCMMVTSFDHHRTSP